jgi:hypothetical protein
MSVLSRVRLAVWRVSNAVYGVRIGEYLTYLRHTLEVAVDEMKVKIVFEGKA